MHLLLLAVLLAFLPLSWPASASEPVIGIALDGGAAGPLEVGQVLLPEGEDAVAFRLLDDSLVRLRGGTVLTLERLDLPQGRQSRLGLGLEQGTVALVPDPAWTSEVRVATPWGEIVLRDAVAQVAFDAQAGLSLTLCQGSAALSATDGTAVHSDGERTSPGRILLPRGGSHLVQADLDPAARALCQDLESQDARGLTAVAALRRAVLAAPVQAEGPEGAPVVGAGTARVLRPLVDGLSGGSDRETTPSVTTLTATPATRP
ncbi:hypothetical protein [Zavarzinia sp. CC-PAN008]|uniref:hypothetical protein n=1 Tax=Zavarzinia sp. CC-PAN008 TaxID=3243332 RepID=UPI003F749046